MTQESSTPPRSLGICVTTRESTRHVLGLAGAAARVKQQQSMLEQKMSRWEELTEFMERDR